MRQWLPEEAELAPGELYEDVSWLVPGSSTASVALGMVAGLDGGVTVEGTSSALGGEGDRAAFRALRDAADAILVGAGTVRAEDYGPVVVRGAAAARRTAAGRADRARLAIVTGRLELSPGHRVFGDPDHLPIVYTSDRGPEDRAEALAAVGVEVVRLGAEAVDLAAVLDDLHSRALSRVLCEGGPTLNGTLLTAGLVEELFVTLAPTVTGADRHLVAGMGPHAVALELVGAVRAGSELVLRYRVDRSAGPDR